MLTSRTSHETGQLRKTFISLLILCKSVSSLCFYGLFSFFMETCPFPPVDGWIGKQLRSVCSCCFSPRPESSSRWGTTQRSPGGKRKKKNNKNVKKKTKNKGRSIWRSFQHIKDRLGCFTLSSFLPFLTHYFTFKAASWTRPWPGTHTRAGLHTHLEEGDALQHAGGAAHLSDGVHGELRRSQIQHRDAQAGGQDGPDGGPTRAVVPDHHVLQEGEESNQVNLT